MAHAPGIREETRISEQDRPSFLADSGRWVMLTGAATVALDRSSSRAPPESGAQLPRHRSLVGDDHRHREVHRLRQLRARLQGRERRAERAGYFRTWVERYQVAADDLDHPTGGLAQRRLRRLPRDRSRRRRASRRSSCPRCATTARTRPACRSARSARRSTAPTASCSSTRPTASAAATACRPVRMAAATSTRGRTPPTSARCVTTASRRA